MLKRLSRLLRPALLCLPLMLTACETTSSGTVLKFELAAIPPDIRACILSLTKTPPKGEMKTTEVVALVTRLRQSEVGKTRCGKRLLALYDAQSFKM